VDPPSQNTNQTLVQTSGSAEEGWNYTSSDTNADGANGEMKDDDDSDEDDDDDDEEEEEGDDGMQSATPSASKDQAQTKHRRCDLLWTGSIVKRIFSGFKFQESKSVSGARKLLESKGAAHYWDMLTNADQLIRASVTAVDSFF
jgi:hypothetical protein